MSKTNAMLTVLETPLEVAKAIGQVRVPGGTQNGLSVAWRNQAFQPDATSYV